MQCEQVWITVRDGTRLAADLYLPSNGRAAPVLLEALPYRKDDLTSESHSQDYLRLRSEGGFAVCRLDLRGTGSSAGRAADEYPRSELDDLGDVISWLAAQPWSNGRVGMFGYSYSGFNSLQLACERPPALGAICAIYATDDRYTDDVHYMGGALRAIDLVDYCHYMIPMNALPPVPAIWGDGWRDEWRARIAEHEPWLLRWMAEQLDGPYWRHGSVRPDYERIECPTMIVAGWADGYRNNT
ncbi:MAG: CocE/NonD family hydrolase, partial [Actinomycetota bacterium]|nr:CocE/NonD family hydrolase [Actinomycetota bacterium]